MLFSLSAKTLANAHSCGKQLEDKFSLIRVQLTKANEFSLSQAFDQYSMAQDELNAIDGSSIEKCGNHQEGIYDILGQWATNISWKLQMENEASDSECKETNFARERWITYGYLAALKATVNLYGTSDFSDEERRAELPLLWAKNHLGKMVDVNVFALSSEEIKYSQKYAHREYLMTAASAPIRCTPPPKSVKNSGPGPTLIQTDAWIIENIPTSYFGAGSFEAVSQKAEYDIDDCSLKVSIDTQNTPKQFSNTFSPLYLVKVDAASQSTSGKSVYFGEDGKGTVNFNEVRISSIIVQKSDTSEMYPLGLGYKEFNLAFRDEEGANRMVNAFRRLASLCGAQNDPF